ASEIRRKIWLRCDGGWLGWSRPHGSKHESLCKLNPETRGGTVRDLFARDLKRVQRLAKSTVQRRLRERSAMPINELLSGCGMFENARRGELLLQELGTIVDVDPTFFRPRVRLGELFTVDRATLVAEASAALKKYG